MDYLFGDLDCLSTESFLAPLAHSKQEFPITQLNRLFASRSTIEIHDMVSQPDFDKLISTIGPENIFKVVIDVVSGPNAVVDKVYQAKLYLENGIIDYKVGWTAYKDTRADELVGSMLYPLLKSGLGDATSIILNGHETRVDLSLNHASIVHSIRSVLSMTNKTLSYPDDWYDDHAKWILNDLTAE